ncbi:MAG: hypothetical protein PIR02_15855 [Microbacterium enclense]
MSDTAVIECINCRRPLPEPELVFGDRWWSTCECGYHETFFDFDAAVAQSEGSLTVDEILAASERAHPEWPFDGPRMISETVLLLSIPPSTDPAAEARAFWFAGWTQYRAALLGYDVLLTRRYDRWMSGLLVVATFGRSVTSSLDRIQSRVPEFVTWYDVEKTRLMRDPVCRWFYALRTDGLKRGELPSTYGVSDHTRDDEEWPVTRQLLWNAPEGFVEPTPQRLAHHYLELLWDLLTRSSDPAGVGRGPQEPQPQAP